MIDIHAIARRYGGTVNGGNALIPTPGHSCRDRGTAIMPSATAPDGVLVHCHNASERDALAVKDMLRRDGFLLPRGHHRSHVPTGVDQAAVNVAEAKAKAERLANIYKAQAVWKNATPVAGTVGDPYLRFRGFAPPYPSAIRFQHLPYDDMGRLPCLVAAVCDVAGTVTGVQRTWLAADGIGKANVPQPKRSLGIIKGSAIRLGDLRDCSTTIVCEGLEDGLSLVAMLQMPCMVATGTSFMPSMQFPAAVRSVIIGSDNDVPGQLAARNAAFAFAERGISVRIVRPLDGFKDFNDELRGHTHD